MPSWMMTLSDPIGNNGHRGQVSLGAEMVYIQFQEPILTHGFGFTTKTKYTVVAQNRIRPYAELAGSPFWTDLARRIPEASSRFNFVLTAGFGVSYFQTDQAALNVGYRFQSIAKAGTRSLSLGLTASLPFGGFSFLF